MKLPAKMDHFTEFLDVRQQFAEGYRFSTVTVKRTDSFLLILALINWNLHFGATGGLFYLACFPLHTNKANF